MMPDICTCPMSVREQLERGGAHSVGCPQWQPFAPHEPDTLRELTADDPRPTRTVGGRWELQGGPVSVQSYGPTGSFCKEDDPQCGGGHYHCPRCGAHVGMTGHECPVFEDADPVEQRDCSEGASFEEHNAAMIELGRCPYCGLEDAR